MVLGDLDSYMQKNEIWPPTYTIHQNKLKMDKDLNISHDTIKVLEENTGKSQVSHIAMFLLMHLLGQGKEKKNKQMGLQQTKKLLHS